MIDLDLFQELYQSISKNKLRTILAGFTVAFAILLFTLLFGIGNGLMNTFEKSFSSDAQNAIFINASRTSKPYRGLQMGRKIQLKNNDYDFLLKEFDSNIQYISPKIEKMSLMTIYKSKQNRYNMRAIYPDYQFLENAKIESGRFINWSDIKNKTKCAVIGKMVETDLFLHTLAIEKQINIDGIVYQIVGVFTDEGGDNDERIIYTPFTTIQKMYGNNDHVNSIELTYNPNLPVKDAINFGTKIEVKLKEKHTVDPEDQGAIRIFNLADANQKMETMHYVLNFIILFIGSGTLIAGIIGISNIMIYNVKERTKEIGIRKALGATPMAIMKMILLEAVLLTTFSGYLGLIIGTLILNSSKTILEKYFILNPTISTPVIVGATIILVLSGVFAGYVPARRAAKIKPIIAINDK
jgi:putative ABC transport system permease protein